MLYGSNFKVKRFLRKRVHTNWVWVNRKGLYECRVISAWSRASMAYGIIFWPLFRWSFSDDTVFRIEYLSKERPRLINKP